MYYNRVVVVGNLTRDVELKYLASGTAVCDIGLAVNDKKKVGEKWEDETLFVDITFFGRTAEVLSEYCRKGSCILVEGRLKLDSWVDKDGNKRSKIKIIGERMQMGSKSDNSNGVSSNVESSENEYVGSTEDVVAPTIDDNNIPF